MPCHRPTLDVDTVSLFRSYSHSIFVLDKTLLTTARVCNSPPALTIASPALPVLALVQRRVRPRLPFVGHRLPIVDAAGDAGVVTRCVIMAVVTTHPVIAA